MLKHGDEIETRVNKGVIKSTVSKIWRQWNTKKRSKSWKI
jgi:hypothetical protein